VLEFLRRTEVVGPDGRTVRLLDAVDVITGVSGGSFTTLAYGLYGDKLFGEGQRINDPVKLIEGLAQQLDLAGAHIDRLAFMSRTLHPQFMGWNVRWIRQKGTQRASVDHAGTARAQRRPRYWPDNCVPALYELPCDF
jgi:hypothetical protein